MKKLSIAGMVFSAIQFCTSLYFIFFVLSKDKIHTDFLKEAKFGGDFNTYSYAAERANAYATSDIGYLIKDFATFAAAIVAILAVIEFIYFAMKKAQNNQPQ